MEESQIPNKRSWPRKIALGCGGFFAVILIFGALAVGGAYWLTSGVAEVGNEFMTALNAGDYEAAYNHLNPSLRDQFVSPESLASLVAEGGVEPNDWSFTSRRTENNLGELAGSVTYQDGHHGKVSLKFEQVNERWLIYDIALNR